MSVVPLFAKRLPPKSPICGAKPNLPAPLAWEPCSLLLHSEEIDHVTYQDGVVITWTHLRVAQFRALMHITETP